MYGVSEMDMSICASRLILSFVICFAIISGSAYASDSDIEALLQMSLEELTDIEITSVSKKSEKASEAAAAVFVITQEDIRRSGATSIPEALRLAPGIQVARSGSHQWAVSARGFNDQFANKLLVLMDGRSVYTPLFAGVWWDAQDTILEDIDRIEVIRGPGGTLWGANAVNGVINIITRDSAETVGNIASVIGGGEDRIASFRHGGEFENGTYRLYGKYSDIDDSETSTGAKADDDWQVARAGFRTDWEQGDKSNITLQGDVYSGREDSALLLPSLTSPTLSTSVLDEQTMRGANILGRWTYVQSGSSEYSLQTYIDHTRRDDVFLKESINTIDIDFQNILTLAESHEVVWGMGYRFIYDNLKGDYISFSPDSRSYDVWSAFAQDKISILPDQGVFITVGSKFEHNDFSGFEMQPSARLTWIVDNNQTLWSSITRSVRTPLRSSSDLSLAAAAVPVSATSVGVLTVIGNRDVKTENAISYEAGYRIQPMENLSFDVALFFTDYSKLFTDSTGTPFVSSSSLFGSHLTIPVNPGNAGSGDAYGGEFVGSWQVMDNWNISATYSLLDLKVKGSSLFVTSEGKSPNQQFNIRSHYAFNEYLEMDNALYYVDALQPNSATSIPSYVRLDTRIGWQPIDGLELSLVGQNLLDDRHPEFSGFIYKGNSEIGRSFYGKATLRF